ncbi:MAG: hypothetical protein RL095_1549 [Verrucomicrobiota bacterium]|jgi:diaminopimelate decarboxylase
MQQLTLAPAQALTAATLAGTPCYVYSQEVLEGQCRRLLSWPVPFGFKVRYAIKANPSRALIRLIAAAGLDFDASSEYEAKRLLVYGIRGDRIQLTAQQLASQHADELFAAGVRFNACSLRQVKEYASRFPGLELSLRVNPGFGSGGTRKTNVGGPGSAFGIWFEQMDEAIALARSLGARLTRLHSHIGSGTDPDAWEQAAQLTLDWALKIPEVRSVNMGGGFKVARMPDEKGVDFDEVGRRIGKLLLRTAESTGRRFDLEIEPGTFVAANIGVLLARVDDLISTGTEGYTFVKLDTGMDALTRPALYGARHPIGFLAAGKGPLGPEQELVVVGHNCESGDLFTVEPGDVLAPRRLPLPSIGDFAQLGGAGAYAAGMSLINYNSFPQIPEVLIERGGEMRLVRRRQTLEQMLQNEVE